MTTAFELQKTGGSVRNGNRVHHLKRTHLIYPRMSFPKHPLHIVIFKGMSDEEVKLIVEKHCEDFDPTVKQFTVSLAKLLKDNPDTYTTNKYGISSARATNSNPEIIVDCIDTGYLKH